MRAMIYLSEVFARDIHPKSSRKALKDADKYFNDRIDVVAANGLEQWRELKTKQIKDLILKSEHLGQQQPSEKPNKAEMATPRKPSD